jgi:hypothetical protein
VYSSAAGQERGIPCKREEVLVERNRTPGYQYTLLCWASKLVNHVKPLGYEGWLSSSHRNQHRRGYRAELRSDSIDPNDVVDLCSTQRASLRPQRARALRALLVGALLAQSGLGKTQTPYKHRTALARGA